MFWLDPYKTFENNFLKFEYPLKKNRKKKEEHPIRAMYPVYTVFWLDDFVFGVWIINLYSNLFWPHGLTPINYIKYLHTFLHVDNFKYDFLYN